MARLGPDFTRLWAGQTVSVFGTLVGSLATRFTAVLTLDAGAGALAVLAACEIAPAFAVGLVAGVWVDRLARRPLMIVCDVGRFAALGTIPLAAAFDVLTLAQLYAVAAVTSVLTVTFDVAYQSYVPSLVGRDELVEANSRLEASASVAEVASFGVGGWLVQLLRGPAAVLVDACTFLVSAAALGRIRTREARSRAATRAPAFRTELREGIGVVTTTPLLRAFAVASMLLALAHQIVGVVFLLYVVELGFRPGPLGVIFAVGGGAAFTGALVARRPRGARGVGPPVVRSVWLRTAGLACIPLAGDASIVAAGLLVLSQLVTDSAWVFYNVHDVSIRQAATSEARRGRMNATLRVAEFGAMLAGTVLAGVLGEVVGLRTALVVAVAVAGAAALWLARSPVARLVALPAHD